MALVFAGISTEVVSHMCMQMVPASPATLEHTCHQGPLEVGTAMYTVSLHGNIVCGTDMPHQCVVWSILKEWLQQNIRKNIFLQEQ